MDAISGAWVPAADAGARVLQRRLLLEPNRARSSASSPPPSSSGQRLLPGQPVYSYHRRHGAVTIASRWPAGDWSLTGNGGPLPAPTSWHDRRRQPDAGVSGTPPCAWSERDSPNVIGGYSRQQRRRPA